MNHYSKEKWLLYKQCVLSSQESKEMEDHLLECDPCLEIFLSLVDDAEIQIASEFISPKFTDTIMKKINTNSKVRSKNLFTYYVAAALVTLILMSSGFFEKLVDTVPYASQTAVIQENLKPENFIMNFSERVVNKTSSFIDNFEVCDKEELK
ncbi:hypothetical protein IZY60_12420 [Lutibacter sp. B2]|nr:hypothetical protein [Lutibacter sp. B2]